VLRSLVLLLCLLHRCASCGVWSLIKNWPILLVCVFRVVLCRVVLSIFLVATRSSLAATAGDGNPAGMTTQHRHDSGCDG
jgi:hypothetical protein